MNTFFSSINYLIPSLNELFAFFLFIVLILSFFYLGKLTTNFNFFNAYNFGIGFYYFVFLFLTLNFFLKLNYILYLYLFTLLILLVNKKRTINYQNYLIELKKNYYLILIIFITFFIFISAKSHGWDTFSFWLPRLDYLIENNQFPPRGFFRAEYPFSFELINYSVLSIIKFNVENIPSLLDCFLIIMIFYIFVEELHKEKIKKFQIPLYILIFFNPLILNTNTFSSYQDLKISFVILLIVSFIYKKNIFLLNKVSLNNILILSSFNAILCVTKNIGVIYFTIISLYFLLVNIYHLKYKLLNNENIKKIIIYILISLSLYFFWRINLSLNNISSGPEFKGVRFEILKEFFSNFIGQIILRKIYTVGLLIFLALFIFTFFLKKKILVKNTLSIIFFIIFFWKLFLVIFALGFQNYNHAIAAHNYWRYFSHLGPIILFGIFIFSVEFKKYFQNIKVNFLLIFFIFIICNFILIEKLRRDLIFPNYQLVELIRNINFNSFDEKKIIYINSNSDKAYQKEIIRYYINRNTDNIFLKQNIYYGSKKPSKQFYQINILDDKVTSNLKLVDNSFN